MTLEMRRQVEPHDGVRRNVRSLVFKSSMHVKCRVVLRPDRVPEPLDRVELLPLGVLGLVDLHQDVLAHYVGAATKDDH